MLQYGRILITSVHEEAVCAFIDAIPASESLVANFVTDKQNPSSRAGSYFRHIIDHEDFTFDIFGFSGDIKRFDFQVEFVLESVPGVILLIEQLDAESLNNSRVLLDFIRAFTPKVYLVVVTSPVIAAGFLRTQLALSETEPLLSCNIKDPNSVKHSLLTFLQLIPQFAENTVLLTKLAQL